ncbi:MAG: DUF4912 domain-containing protein, partial [Acidobacteriota bacterium]|nr:DUF4912 domain-containing protein [Acidobacteriota bacterium]
MNEQDLKTTDTETSPETSTVEKPIEKKFLPDDFKIDSTADVSSPTRKPIVESETQDAEVVLAETEQSEVFKELSEPKLPELARENRARLQMQSPTKIYFYWSIKTNPFQTLNRVFGNQTNYTLVAKLINQTTKREELFPVEAEGSTWFDVDANSTYRAEIGFYATNRPFVRVMFSNILETPRKNPSPRRDYSQNFTVSANQFAEVLDVSGFQQDAFEVALAGDDVEFADNATQAAFSQIISATRRDFDTNKLSEIRFVLLALAAGYSLEDLREHISPSLFTVLQGNAEN